MYGIPEPYVLPNTIPVFWKLTRSLFISVAFIIGFCIYLRKSSSSILRKVITIIIALILVLLTCLGINNIITDFYMKGY